MAPPPDSSFNPSSPRSSTGGEDSYKHDGTPDTRLTAFSPDEDSARSIRFVKPFNQSVRQSEPLPFPMKQTNDQGKSCAEGKDPFMPVASSAKNGRKLSPTASSFEPVFESSSAQGTAPSHPLFATHRGPGFQQWSATTFSDLSKDLGLSRCLVLTSNIQAILPADIDVFLSVCSAYCLPLQVIYLFNRAAYWLTAAQNMGRRGFSLQGERQVQGHHESAYIRFTDIRDARMVHDNIARDGPGWRAHYVQPPLSPVRLCCQKILGFLNTLPLT